MNVTVLRRYQEFSIWDNGVVTKPTAQSWDEADPEFDDEHIDAVAAAERVIAEHHPAEGPCGEDCDACGAPCRGWAIFDSSARGSEIERVDACHRFADDDAAFVAALVFFDQHATRKDP